jgi:hypothetical protein
VARSFSFVGANMLIHPVANVVYTKHIQIDKVFNAAFLVAIVFTKSPECLVLVYLAKGQLSAEPI